MLRRCSSPYLFMLLAAGLAAQQPSASNKPASDPAAPKSRAELDQKVATLLVAFARTAEANKLPSQARRTFEQILDHYDTDNPPARAGLGWKRGKGEWQQTTPSAKLPPDSGNRDQQRTVAQAWTKACERIGGMHRALGQQMLNDGDRAAGIYQLERALVFLPGDPTTHRALGHEELDGFFGTAEELAFVRRMREILAAARSLAELPIEAAPVPQTELPRELQATGYSFQGARTANTTVWVVGSYEEAANFAAWYERGGRLLEFVFGSGPTTRRHLNRNPLRWTVVLRTAEQRAHLLEVSPTVRHKEPLERAVLFTSNWFDAANGRAEWMFHGRESDADMAVGLVTKRGTRSFNQAFTEGLVHTMTWLLCGSVQASYMLLPATTQGVGRIPRTPDAWLQQLQDQVEAGTDWELAQIPRERLDNFREPVRFKSWQFVLWLLARYPDRWATLLAELGHDQRLPEEVVAIFAKVLERPLGEVEQEWRAWVRRGSLIGKAAGTR